MSENDGLDGASFAQFDQEKSFLGNDILFNGG